MSWTAPAAPAYAFSQPAPSPWRPSARSCCVERAGACVESWGRHERTHAYAGPADRGDAVRGRGGAYLFDPALRAPRPPPARPRRHLALAGRGRGRLRVLGDGPGALHDVDPRARRGD